MAIANPITITDHMKPQHATQQPIPKLELNLESAAEAVNILHRAITRKSPHKMTAIKLKTSEV